MASTARWPSASASANGWNHAQLPLPRICPTPAAEPRGTRVPLRAVPGCTWTLKNCRRCWRAGTVCIGHVSRRPRSAVPTTWAIRSCPWPTPFGIWSRSGRAGGRPGRSACSRLLRNWGHYFSPLSLYYCFDRSGQTVDAVVAEVTNTPWHERHWYVLWQGNRIGEPSQLRFRHPKGFHVSPFMDMDMLYEWHLDEPGAQLTWRSSIPGAMSGSSTSAWS